MNHNCIYMGAALARYGFGAAHPFGTDRMDAFAREFKIRKLDRFWRVNPPRPTTPEALMLFHGAEYIQRLQDASRDGKGFLDDGDTPAFQGILEASLTVAGTVIHAADQLMAGECRHAFVPIAGLHHARRDSAAGFCAINDCGIVIEHLKKHHGLERIAYVDIDAHHGDGVFYAFEDDPAVIFVDFHEDGRFLYPGTGDASESGRGAAAGLKLNVPLPPRATDELFEKLWPAAERFLHRHDIQFCILQAGADSIAGDPITSMRLTPAIHARVAMSLSKLPCQRLLMLGGGGYNRDNLARTWNNMLRALSP